MEKHTVMNKFLEEKNALDVVTPLLTHSLQFSPHENDCSMVDFRERSDT